MAATNKFNMKKNDPFAKKVPQNPKYKNTKCVVNTGASISNYMNKIDDIRKNYRFRKDEIFKRMKVSTFSQLVLQVAQVVNMELERLQLETARTDMSEYEEAPEDIPDDESVYSNAGSDTSRSTLQSVIGGMGEVDMNAENNNSKPKESEVLLDIPDATSLPYVLLDVREKDEFDKCHVIGAVNYPSTMLTRSVNYFSKEILCFKNKPGKIIIVYDEDERLAPHVATVMVQKDVDNVLMLSGGMKVLHKKFPGCFLSGTLPSTCYSPVPERKGKQTKKPPVVTQNEHIQWYNSELLENINYHLDELLLSNESSRMSSRNSSASSIASSRQTARDSKKPTTPAWK